MEVWRYSDDGTALDLGYCEARVSQQQRNTNAPNHSNTSLSLLLALSLHSFLSCTMPLRAAVLAFLIVALVDASSLAASCPATELTCPVTSLPNGTVTAYCCDGVSCCHPGDGCCTAAAPVCCPGYNGSACCAVDGDCCRADNGTSYCCPSGSQCDATRTGCVTRACAPGSEVCVSADGTSYVCCQTASQQCCFGACCPHNTVCSGYGECASPAPCPATQWACIDSSNNAYCCGPDLCCSGDTSTCCTADRPQCCNSMYAGTAPQCCGVTDSCCMIQGAGSTCCPPGTQCCAYGGPTQYSPFCCNESNETCNYNTMSCDPITPTPPPPPPCNVTELFTAVTVAHCSVPAAPYYCVDGGTAAGQCAAEPFRAPSDACGAQCSIIGAPNCTAPCWQDECQYYVPCPSTAPYLCMSGSAEGSCSASWDFWITPGVAGTLCAACCDATSCEQSPK